MSVSVIWIWIRWEKEFIQPSNSEKGVYFLSVWCIQVFMYLCLDIPREQFRRKHADIQKEISKHTSENMDDTNALETDCWHTSQGTTSGR